jgi:hypothetical protein
MIDERLRHIQVLESQIESNKEVVAALRELEENLVVRIDESTGEATALAEMALARIEELREILHRLWKAGSMRWRFRSTATGLRDRPTL